MKKDPLRICTIAIMVIALIIIFLITSYAFGLNILPRLIPNIPKPRPFKLYSESFLNYYRIVYLLLFPLCSVGTILLSFKRVLAQEYSCGIKPEFYLITFSLIMVGFGLQVLGSEIPYRPDLTDLLSTISLVFAILGIGTLIIGAVYKYLVEKK
ncbi:MAG: hypothetical protein PVF58_19730 [Candidatus Methanofastidiosia archaeon]